MNPKSVSPRAVSLWVLCAWMLTCVSCAAQRQQVAVEDAVREHVYPMPLHQVWPQALALLKDKGFTVKADATRYEARTDWEQITPPSSLGTSYANYFVVGKERGPGRCTIRYFRNDRSTAVPPSQPGGADPHPEYQRDGIQGLGLVPMDRDRQLEWQLLQRVEPELALSLQAKP